MFAEAPLAAPRIPLLKMRVPKWAVVARVLWHAGYHPEIENYRKAKHRAAQAADILIEKLIDGGAAVPERPRERERPEEERPHERERPEKKTSAVALVAHGYFNAMIGRQLRQRGFARTGAHRVRYWNAVIYEWNQP